MLRVLKSQKGVIRNGSFRPANSITDRAKRYRANRNIEPRQKNCFACGKPNPRDVHHIDGNESHGDPGNLTKACRSCNVRIANTMRRAGLGKKTRQYNPSKRRPSSKGDGARSLGAYLSAVQIVRGDQPGNVTSAVKTLRATTPGQRSEYARRIWDIRRERYGPTGRSESSQSEIPF